MKSIHAKRFLNSKWKFSCHPYWPKKVDLEKEFVYLCEDEFHAERGSFILDLGWYPDGNRNGSYCLRLIDTDDGGWERPMALIRTRDIGVLTKFRDLMIKVANKAANK